MTAPLPEPAEPAGPAFGALLRAWRERAGLTQEELAERAGLTPHAVSALERGARTRPYPHTVRSLAEGLGLDDGDRLRLLAAVPSRGAAPRGPVVPAPRQAPRAGRSVGPLPAAPHGLVGRDEDLVAVTRLLHEPGVRIVTLTGTGGVGKTRLSLAVAAALEAAYPDGVTVVPLAALGDPGLIVPSIGRAVGLGPVEGLAATALVTEHLRGLRMLLVLDNLEHLLDGAADVGALVAECPGLTVLATSRAALRLRDEREYRVQPLALPPAGPVRVPDVAASPAAALFVERASAVSPRFALTPGNAEVVAALCGRLAGIPLALELAAARMRVLSPADLLARLDEAMSGTGARDLPARQRTMRATLDWSHGLLAEPEQRLFRRLAVFSGGWTLEAVEAVASAPGDLARGDVVLLLEALVEHSLVVVTEAGEGERRYAMLEPVAQYARLRLDASRDADAAGLAHAQHFLDLAERAAPEYERADQVAWLGRVGREDDNMSAALDWCLAHGHAEIAARLGWALWLYWWLRGQLRHGRRCMELALEHPLPPPVRARALLTGAALSFAQGDLAASGPGWEQALAVAVSSGDGAAEAGAVAGVGLVALAGEDLPKAAACFRSAIEVAERVGPEVEWVAALSHIWLGTALLVGGDASAAAVQFGRGLASASRRGDRLATYIGLFNLSQVAIAQDDFATARRHLQEGMLLSQQTGDLANLAYFLDALAVVESAQGQPHRVAVLLGAAQALRETVGANVYGYYLPDDALRVRSAEQARQALGQDGYDDLVDAGRALDPDEAVAYAVQTGESAAHPLRG